MSLITSYWDQYWSFLLNTLGEFHVAASAIQLIAIIITVILGLIALRIVKGIFTVFVGR